MASPDHKLHKVLARFPWRRRKPRGSGGVAPIAMVTKEGRRLWANAEELAAFDDPGPALVCVAIREDTVAHALVRGLVRHHAEARGVQLPPPGPDLTVEGVALLGGLLEDAGLDPEEPLGAHPLGDLVQATWAIAAATGSVSRPSSQS
ncbi:MAG: hypothetical protein AAGA54_01800 [Myxococcota bacterium]